uniref:DUF834 domain-containing protein n=1 Tax=Oryza nivara TaxID=4536 RepID=A0A0E0H1N9_ORYNI
MGRCEVADPATGRRKAADPQRRWQAEAVEVAGARQQGRRGGGDRRGSAAASSRRRRLRPTGLGSGNGDGGGDFKEDDAGDSDSLYL